MVNDDQEREDVSTTASDGDVNSSWVDGVQEEGEEDDEDGKPRRRST